MQRGMHKNSLLDLDSAANAMLEMEKQTWPLPPSFFKGTIAKKPRAGAGNSCHFSARTLFALFFIAFLIPATHIRNALAKSTGARPLPLELSQSIVS
jgi:hypothetical protein